MAGRLAAEAVPTRLAHFRRQSLPAQARIITCFLEAAQAAFAAEQKRGPEPRVYALGVLTHLGFPRSPWLIGQPGELRLVASAGNPQTVRCELVRKPVWGKFVTWYTGSAYSVMRKLAQNVQRFLYAIRLK